MFRCPRPPFSISFSHYFSFRSKRSLVATRNTKEKINFRIVSSLAAASLIMNKIGECLRQAKDCARKAAAQSDPLLKKDYLDLERRWLLLARSYELGDRLTDFSNEVKRRVRGFSRPEEPHTSRPQSTVGKPSEQVPSITPFLQRKAFDPEVVEAMSAAPSVARRFD